MNLQRLVIIFGFTLSAGLSAQAQSEPDAEAFYRQQVMQDIRSRDTNPVALPPKNQNYRPNPYTNDTDVPVVVYDEGSRSYVESQASEEEDLEDYGKTAEAPGNYEQAVGDSSANKVRFNQPQTIYATPAPQQKYKVKREEREQRTWGFGLDVSSGYSTNIARFEGAPSGSFIDIAPNAHWFGRLGKRFHFDVSGDFFYRTFNDQQIDELFRTFVANAAGDFDFYVTPTIYLGLAGRTTQFDGREIDFTSPNTNDGRDSRLAVNAVTLSVGKEWRKAFAELFSTSEFVRGQTTVLDEAGNQFFPDLNQISGGLRVGAQFFQNLRWEGTYEYKYRQFLDQRARLQNGLVDPNFAGADFLLETEHSFLSSIFLYDLLLETGYDMVEDQNAGAMTRQSAYGTIVLPIELFGTMLFRPEAGIRFTKFDNFIDQIFRNPNADKKRDDLWTTYGADLIVDLGMIDPVLTYRRTSLDSNYTIIEFEEDLISVGLEAAF